MSAERNTLLIRNECLRLGFGHCGISKATFLKEEAPLLEQWLNEKKHGSMQWMENHFDKRLDPRLLVPGAKSVISLSLNYYPEKDLVSPGSPKISKYAYGTDYHIVIKEKLKALIAFIRENIGEVNARGFVDSAPVMDKAWAQKSGLGWLGKNSNLIRKDSGSFFFLSELICDMELIYDAPVADHCGDCTRCIDACPTDAINTPYVVDGSKCISYYTIELRDQIPESEKGKFQDWVFGCDICQDVCPWNSFSTPHKEPAFRPKEEILNFNKKDWEQLTEEVFNRAFADSAISRTGFKGLKRNLQFIRL